MFKNKKPKGGPISSLVMSAAQRKAATESTMAASLAAPNLPNDDDPNILDAAKAEEARRRKQLGRASTLLNGNTERPKTIVQTIKAGASY